MLSRYSVYSMLDWNMYDTLSEGNTNDNISNIEFGWTSIWLSMSTYQVYIKYRISQSRSHRFVFWLSISIRISTIEYRNRIAYFFGHRYRCVSTIEIASNICFVIGIDGYIECRSRVISFLVLDMISKSMVARYPIMYSMATYALNVTLQQIICM